MEAPGGGGDGWSYSDRYYRWSYIGEDGQPHRGWLDFDGEWYWFDGNGRMAEGGSVVIDGVSYYFFSNGHMAWNQYVGQKYMDANGKNDSAHDVRVIGSAKPTSEDWELFTDYLYEVPRSWLARFTADGWQFMFYKKKSVFAAPVTDGRVYPVYHQTDLHYEKVKFTSVDAVLQAFGEYVGEAAGCYEEESAWMQRLWDEQPALVEVLKIPGYYADDKQFYFGKLFAGYLDGETRSELEELSPEVCGVLDEILYMNEKASVRTRKVAEAKEAREQKALRAEKEAGEEQYGPGVRKKQADAYSSSASASQRSYSASS